MTNFLMKAMLLEHQRQPLRLTEVPRPEPDSGQVLVKVSSCGLCRTDLHVVEGDLTEPVLPLIPGHQIVGKVEQLGGEVASVSVGDRVGIPWLGHTCGVCAFCTAGRENLCDAARFTGYQIDGGYADYLTADQRYCFPLADGISDAEAAPR